MALSPINPTQLTPPRVALIDDRSGAISREWYRFFLSLLTATQNTQDEAELAPDTESLLASYDAVFSDAIQGLEAAPDANAQLASLDAKLNSLTQTVESAPDCCTETASVQDELNDLSQTVLTQPRAELGTMAALQQADVPWFTFNTAPTPVPTAIGSMYWDGGTTLNIQATANVIMRVGETEYAYVKASAAITKGQLCYHTGAVGTSGVVTAAPTPLALADPNQIIGVAAETIALNGFGLIQISGTLRGFNTTGSSVGETWADGDPLYYNPAYVGSFTKTKPSAPNQKTYIGEVINAGTGSSGSIVIRLSPGSTLGGTDSNVQFGTLANNDLIQYDSTAQYWKNVPASSIAIGTATALAGGAANRIAYQTAPNTTSFIVAPTSANTYLEWSGTAFQWSANPLGTVTSVSGTGTVNGLTLTGTVTTSGSLTLGGTLSNIANSALTNSSITINGSAISLGGSVSVGTVTSASVVSANGFAGTVATATTTPAITITTTVTGVLKGNGTAISAATANVDYIAPSSPVTKTADFTVADGDTWIINNKSGSTCTVTLPSAASFLGRYLTFQNYQDQNLVSASSNVVPQGGGAAGTAILTNVNGNWATLVSNGTNWVIMQAASFNTLLY